MDFGVSPFLAGDFSNIIQTLSDVAAGALADVITQEFDNTIRPTLNWGTDHEITFEKFDSALGANVQFTIIVPYLRNRPSNVAELRDSVLPGLFEFSANHIATEVANKIASGIAGIGRSAFSLIGL